MSHSTALPLADTSDMIEMHRVFRICFSQSPRLVESVVPEDVERADLVASYCGNVLRLLRAHHEGEDLLLTPKLLERNPDQADVITRIASQHSDVVGSMDEAERRLSEWSDSPTEVARAEATQALARLDERLGVHLDSEEEQILPIAARCINVAEWGELPAHGLQHFDGDKPWLIIGLIRDQMSPEHRAEMDAHLPPPVATMWDTTGREMYGAFMRQLDEQP